MMDRDIVLFSISGVGFGLFFGFGFASWANMRAGATLTGDGRATQAQLASNGVAAQQRTETAARAGGALAGDGRATQAQLASNGVADQQRLETAAQAAVKAARENPSNYEAQMRAARASFETERLDDALEFLLRANTLQP